MKIPKWPALALVAMVCLLFTGCVGAGSTKLPSDLNAFLPKVENTTLFYDETMDGGLAMELQVVEHTNGLTRYTFLVFIQDGLGHIGVKGEDRTYYIIYEVSDTEINQIIKNESGSDISRTVLKAPLTVGNTWAGDYSYEGSKYVGRYEIVDLADDKVTVLFEANGVEGYHEGRYEEEYVFSHGKSIISLSKTIPWHEGGKVAPAPFNFERRLHDINTDGFKRTAYSQELDAYMPDQKHRNGVFHYQGLAEYAHTMELDFNRTNRGGDVRVYGFRGCLEDGSGFLNQNFTITCIIDQERIYEEIETTYEDLNHCSFISQHNINSYRNYPTLLKMPLEVGTRWEDILLIDKETCPASTSITAIEFNAETARNEITTVTEAKVAPHLHYQNDTYIEERVFAEGVGLVSFTRSNPANETSGQGTYFDFSYVLSCIVDK